VAKEIVIKTQGITKVYGKQIVVNNVSMTIYQGDIYGFIGSNGSGKTTFIRCLMGLTYPQAGEIEILGCSGKSAGIGQARAKTGCIVETPALMLNFNAYNCLKAHALLYKDKVDDKQIYDLLKLVGLDDLGNKKVKDFSLGMRQRMAIAQTLINDPKILILDEPTNGMDPQGIVEMRKFLHMLRDTRGLTILISSHILGELQQLADRFGIINNGVLVDEFDGKDIEARSNSRTQIKLQISNPDDGVYQRLQQVLQQVFAISHTQTNTDGNESIAEQNAAQSQRYILQGAELTVDEQDFNSINRALVQADIEYKFVSKTHTSLEDYFITKVGV